MGRYGEIWGDVSGQARLGALARAIVPPLATRVLPAAAARLLALSSCGRGAPPPPGLTPPPGQPPTGHLLWVRLGGAGFGAAEAAIAARGARAGAGGASGRRIDASRGALSGCSAATDAACVALCLALAPGLRCATLWLPTDAAAPDSEEEEEGEEGEGGEGGEPGRAPSRPSSYPPLLDEDEAAVRHAALAVLESASSARGSAPRLSRGLAGE